MVMSKKLTPERIAEIMAFPITYDEDCPKLTKEQLAEFRSAHPENFAKERRQEINERAIDLSDIRELTEADFSRGHFRNKVEVKIMMEAGRSKNSTRQGLIWNRTSIRRCARRWRNTAREWQ